MREKVMSNFPITINPTEEGFEEKVRSCMGFLNQDIVDAIIADNRRTQFLNTNRNIRHPADLIDRLITWEDAKERTIDFWNAIYYALRNFHTTGELDQKYLRQETLQKRTILL